MTMTQENEMQTKSIQSVSVLTPVLVGAGIALLMISLFVFRVKSPDPTWGEYWMIRPLIVTLLAGACAGVFYAFMNYQIEGGFNRTIGIIISLVAFLIALWLGIVLGLDGTLWN